MKNKVGRTEIHSLILKKIFVFNITAILGMVLLFVVLVTHNFLKFYSESHLEILKQISERYKVVNNVTQYLSQTIYDEYGQLISEDVDLNQAEIGENIEKLIEKDRGIFKALQIDPTVMIILDNGYVYKSSGETDLMVQNVKNSYWYVENYFNDKKDCWIVRFAEVTDVVKTKASYCNIIRSSSGEYKGIILVSVMEDILNELYSDIANNNTTMFILDENGTAISHSVDSLVGSNLYYMPAFFNAFEKNSTRLVKNGTTTALATNYYEVDTGWTIVEETDIISVLSDYYPVFILFMGVCIFFSIVTYIISRLLANRISMPMRKIADELVESNMNGFKRIVPVNDYKEVSILSDIYNKSMNKIDLLINETKKTEKEKRDAEISFLQAQINPHFMHNTLFVIKCAIDMKRYEKASDMISLLMKMLKMPLTIKRGWIKISEEVEYLDNYIKLVQNRDENTEIRFQIEAPDDLKETFIPRLMLQPIIENSIIHGFADIDNPEIRVIVSHINNRLIIRICDNGIGMTSEQIKALWTKPEESKKGFNRIGLKNIRDRLNLLYGNEYGITILSKKGKGTEVILNMKVLTYEDVE